MISKWHKNPTFCSILIACLCFIVYLNALKGNFVWDDNDQILKSPVIKELQNIPTFFTADIWKLMDGSDSYYYRPFFLLSLTIDYALWGIKPFGYHITNILLHVFSTILVYQIGRKIFLEDMPALIGGMLFAVLPVHVESVSWISGRTDSMAALFFLFAFYLYIIHRKKKDILILIFSIVAYCFALFSKEMAITFPILLVAYEVSFKKPGHANKTILRSLQVIGIYLLVSCIYLLIRAIVLKGAVYDTSSIVTQLDNRLFISFKIVLDYLRIMILPVNLKVFYHVSLKEKFFDLEVIFSALLLASVFTASLLTFFKDRKIFFSSVWFFITILPVSGIVPLRPTMMAERYLYIPSIGFCMLIGLLIFKIYQAKLSSSVYFKYILLFVFICFSFLTVQRNTLWKNDTTLFSAMVADAPEEALPNYNVGVMLDEQGRNDEAIKYYKETLRIKPEYIKARLNLGIIYDEQGSTDEAIKEYRTVINTKGSSATAHNNLANIYDRKGEFSKAVYHYKEAIRLKPTWVEAYINLGLTLEDHGRIDEARHYFQEASDIYVEDVETLFFLAEFFGQRNQIEISQKYLTKISQLDPIGSEIYNRKGRIKVQ